MRRGNGTLDAWLKTSNGKPSTAEQNTNQPKSCKGRLSAAKDQNEAGKSLSAYLKPSKQPDKPRKPDPPPTTDAHAAGSNPVSSFPAHRFLPADTVCDFLLLADFCWTFSDLIKPPKFSIERLYNDLLQPTPTHLVHCLTIALVREAAKSIVVRGGEELVSDEMAHFQVFQKVGQQLDVEELAEKVPFLLMGEAIASPEYVGEDGEGEGCDRILDFSSFYSDFPLASKLSIYRLLVTIILDSPTLHDLLTARMEEKLHLSQKKHDLEAQLRVFNKSHRGEHFKKGSDGWSQKQRIKKEIQEVRDEADSIPIRTEALGSDRWGNTYYCFEFDTSVVYAEAGEESADWREVCTPAQLKAVKSALNLKDPTEKSLFDALDRISLTANSVSDDSSDSTMDVEQPIDPDGYLRQACIEWLFRLEAKVSTFFGATGKYWAEERDVRDWKGDVTTAATPNRLKELLALFSDQATTPFKQTPPPESLLKRVNLRLWADISQDWERLWARAVSWEHVLALVAVVAAVFEGYFHSKRKTFLNATAKAMKELNSGIGVRTRRLTRMSEKLRVQELLAEETHDDVCMVCDMGGDLLCCDRCPQVAHAKCVGLSVIFTQSIPDDSWFCDSCQT